MIGNPSAREPVPDPAGPGPTPSGRATRRVLIVVAAEIEAAAVARGLGATPPSVPWDAANVADDMELVISGIGKANAAGAVAAAIVRRPYALVLNLGLAGALPSRTGASGPPAFDLSPGDLVLATAHAFADEGLGSPSGFTACKDMGFPVAGTGHSAYRVDTIPGDPRWLGMFRDRDPPWALRLATPERLTLAPIATVSTCSGTDRSACEVAERTGARAEAMEGAAAALVAWRLGVHYGEIRAISNTTGDRGRQVWDVPAAAAALGGLFSVG
ncbi:MAG: futalosine hydrolase [Phycisphaeraceae bacterium]|nr:MAG: futalosine hydrolase [Phycisphaeraceae bacterium]